MATTGAGYTGAIYSETAVGYTAAEGYTGVVYSPSTSGFTGSAPIARRGRASSASARPTSGAGAWPSASTSALPLPGSAASAVQESPYDEALCRASAPGAGDPLDYSRPGGSPAAPTLGGDGPEAQPDDDQQATPSESEDTEAVEISPADPTIQRRDDARRDGIEGLVESLLGLEHQWRLSPPQSSNEALRRAEAIINRASRPPLQGEGSGTSGRGPFGPFNPFNPLGPFGPDIRHSTEELAGEAATAIKQQAAKVLGKSDSDSLGWVYAQGVVWGLFDGIVDNAAGAVSSTVGAIVDPVGLAIDSGTETINQVRERMASGETLLEAASNTALSPISRIVEGARRGNALAGEALEAARNHNRQEAIRLVLESGHSVGEAGLATGTTFGGVVQGGLNLAKKVRLKRALRRAPPTPSSPPHGTPPSRPPRPVDSPERTVPVFSEENPAPAVSTQPAGITGTVDHAPPPAAPVPKRRFSTRHPKYPEVPVLGPEKRRRLAQMERELLEINEREAAAEIQTMPPERGMNQNVRNNLAQPIRRSREHLTALDAQAANPADGFVTQARWEAIVLPNGTEIPVQQIPTAVTGKRKSLMRISDALGIRTDGTWYTPEYKTNRELSTAMGAYPGKLNNIPGWRPGDRPAVRGSPERADFRSSRLAAEFQREQEILAAARRFEGAKIRVRGETLDYRPVTLDLPVAENVGRVPVMYGQVGAPGGGN